MATTFIVRPDLAFGRVPRTKAEVDHLLSQGFTHVIDCQQSSVPGRMVGKSFAYQQHAIDDSLATLPAWWFEKAGRAASTVLQKSGAKLLVCCAQGRRRSPALVYYLLRRAGTSAADAEALVRAARTSISNVYFASADAAL